MATILKSTVKYTGQNALLHARQVSMTAQEIYDEYSARVVADGGTIADPARTLDTINFLHEQKLFGKMNAVVSPAYGIKMSGSSVLKLYSIDGEDLLSVTAGAADPATIDNTIAEPRVEIIAPSANTGTYFISENKIRPSLYGMGGILLVAEYNASAPRSVYSGYTGGAGSGQLTAVQQTTLGASFSSIIKNASWDGSAATNASTTSIAAPTNTDTVMQFVDESSGTHELIKNGASANIAGTTTVSSLWKTREQYLCLGALLNDGGPSTSSGWIAEFWAPRDISRDQALSATLFCSGVYQP